MLFFFFWGGGGGDEKVRKNEEKTPLKPAISIMLQVPWDLLKPTLLSQDKIPWVSNYSLGPQACPQKM